MDYIFVAIGGAIIGIMSVLLLALKNKTHGIIEVDHNTEQCKIRITSAELSNRKTKKVIFTVNHDARISRENQTL